jgi:hypothetical protein
MPIVMNYGVICVDRALDQAGAGRNGHQLSDSTLGSGLPSPANLQTGAIFSKAHVLLNQGSSGL